jgi:uncharacterized protein
MAGPSAPAANDAGVPDTVMPRKLVILLVNTDPGRSIELGAPLFQAAAAASMDYAVDVICAGASGALMKKGVADGIFIKPESGRTVGDFIRMSHKAGARFLMCASTFELYSFTEADLIPECDGITAVTEYVAEMLDDECRILTY